jgi:cell division septum initiation protein DivIVA
MVENTKSDSIIETQELTAKLQQFEQQYQMDSRSFYAEFQSGQLDDTADFFEWSTYYEMLITHPEQDFLNCYNVPNSHLESTGHARNSQL